MAGTRIPWGRGIFTLVLPFASIYRLKPWLGQPARTSLFTQPGYFPSKAASVCETSYDTVGLQSGCLNTGGKLLSIQSYQEPCWGPGSTHLAVCQKTQCHHSCQLSSGSEVVTGYQTLLQERAHICMALLARAQPQQQDTMVSSHFPLPDPMWGSQYWSCLQGPAWGNGRGSAVFKKPLLGRDRKEVQRGRRMNGNLHSLFAASTCLLLLLFDFSAMMK